MRNHNFQQGSALIICMVFLLLLTILGVSSMQSATLQEKMTGNAVDENRAFQRAEAALRVGEKALQDNPGNFSTPDQDPTLPSLGQVPSSGWSAAESNAGYYHITKLSTATDVYRVTAIGYGLSADTRVVLQSTYRPF
jgi:type IV pilus assembly protein PilX